MKMKRNELGKTGISVSEVCFGTLTLGPLQKNLTIEQARPILTRAYEKGINFYDTADMYNTYSYLRELLKVDRDLVICSRSYDYSADGLNRSLERALRELDRDYVDLFLLHEQESRYTFEGHWEAIEALIEAKRQGKVRAIGVSTHRIEAVRDIVDFDELEVVFSLINPMGLGIEDGSAKEMRQALKRARKAGKAVMAMKPLGGGNLLRHRVPCLKYARSLLDHKIVDTVALGMQSLDEVDYNTAFFNGQSVDPLMIKRLDAYSRELHIDDWCERCGSCVKKCHQNALKITEDGIQIDRKKCLTCGYCSSVCPVFAIKVV